MDCVILAAGKGTRMKSTTPKVLHEIGGMSLIEHLLASINPLELSSVIVVVGYKEQLVRSALSNREVKFSIQKDQKGTAHALQQAKREIESDTFMVLPGDLPLVKTSSLREFVSFANEEEADLSLLTVSRDDPTGYGRIKRASNGGLEEIVEEQDATEEEKKIKEINTGIYLLSNQEDLWRELDSIGSENAQGEYYLTDLVKRFATSGKKVVAYQAKRTEEFLGVNTRKDLVSAGKVLNRRKIDSLLEYGVTVVDPNTTIIETKPSFDQDTVIEPFTIIRGETSIGTNSRIGPHVEIVDSKIGKGVKLSHSVVKNTTIRDNKKLEPFSFLKPDS